MLGLISPDVYSEPDELQYEETVTCPIVDPWRTLDFLSQHKDNPWREQKRRERLTRNKIVMLRHFILSSCTVLTSYCRLLHIKAFYQLWSKKGFLLPWFSLAYGWRWGRNLPTSPHRRLVNVPILCISSVGRTTHLLLFAFYASLGKLFFSHLKIFLGRNMLPSALPLCCNYLLWSQTVRQCVVLQ